MPLVQTLVAFFGVSVLLALSPGPDNIFVLLQSAQHGWRAGVAVVIGLCIGIVGHTTAVALGLAAVVAASATAFTVLKMIGAAYLLWLAWGALRAPAVAVPKGQAATAPISYWRMVRRGVILNLSNPKVLVFFLAFLPQFADPQRGSMARQIGVLGLVFILSTLLVFGGIAVFSGRIGSLLLRSPRAQWVLSRGAGLVFLGLALRLATAQK